MVLRATAPRSREPHRSRFDTEVRALETELRAAADRGGGLRVAHERHAGVLRKTPDTGEVDASAAATSCEVRISISDQSDVGLLQRQRDTVVEQTAVEPGHRLEADPAAKWPSARRGRRRPRRSAPEQDRACRSIRVNMWSGSRPTSSANIHLGNVVEPADAVDDPVQAAESQGGSPEPAQVGGRVLAAHEHGAEGFRNGYSARARERELGQPRNITPRC